MNGKKGMSEAQLLLSKEERESLLSLTLSLSLFIRLFRMLRQCVCARVYVMLCAIFRPRIRLQNAERRARQAGSLVVMNGIAK